MKKTHLGKSFYTTYAPNVIVKELHREFRLPYVEAMEMDSDYDYRLVCVVVECNEKDTIDIQRFLSRFDAER